MNKNTKKNEDAFARRHTGLWLGRTVAWLVVVCRGDFTYALYTRPNTLFSFI
jgi:hypothetical protein